PAGDRRGARARPRRRVLRRRLPAPRAAGAPPRRRRAPRAVGLRGRGRPRGRLDSRHAVPSASGPRRGDPRARGHRRRHPRGGPDMIPALIIGRKGSRVKDKNVRPILGRPLALYPILAAKHARSVTDVFVSTDSEKIQEIAVAQGCTYIERPAFLATNEALAEDAFKHGYEAIVAQARDPIEFIVLLFANGATITP